MVSQDTAPQPSLPVSTAPADLDQHPVPVPDESAIGSPPTAGRSSSNGSAPQAGSPTPSPAPAPDQPPAADDDTSVADQSESSDDGLFSLLLASKRRPCFSWRWRRRMEQEQQWATFLHAEDEHLDDPEWCIAHGLPPSGILDDIEYDTDGKCLACLNWSLSSTVLQLMLSFVVPVHCCRLSLSS